MTVTYYHGGVTGLRVGDLILPPSETDAVSMAAIESAPPEMRAELARVHRTDRVYLTTFLDAAVLFARYYPRGTRDRGGDVYRVEPIGAVEPDPDYLGDDDGSVCAPRARVVGIVATSVRRTRDARRGWAAVR